MAIIQEKLRADRLSELSPDECKHDLTYELGRRLLYMSEYERFFENARGKPELQEFWRGVRSREQRLVGQLLRLIDSHSQRLCQETPRGQMGADDE